MENKGKKRISIITVIIFMVIIILIFVALKVFVITPNQESASNDNVVNSTSNKITNIQGEEYIKLEEGVKVNISQMLQEDKILEEFTFNNFYIYSIDNVTRIEFDVTNNSNVRSALEKFKFLIYNEKEKVGEISGIGEEIAAGQVKKLNMTVNADIANLYDIKVEKIYTQEI